MEEKLLKLFECARLEGNTEREMLSKLYPESTGKLFKKPEYKVARKSGLNMMQAELCTLLAQELRICGIEGLLNRLEASKDTYSSKLHKKRQRKNRDDPELKKKSKF